MKLRTSALISLAVTIVLTGCSNSANHRGSYLLSRGFAPYEKENPIARASALAVAPDAVAGVAPNKSGEYYFFRGDLRTRELDAEPVSNREEGETRLAQARAQDPATWQTVAPGSPQALAAMRTLNVASPRRPYVRSTSSRLGDDQPVNTMSDLQPHRLPDGAGVSAAGN